jgi:hypothetical protein
MLSNRGTQAAGKARNGEEGCLTSASRKQSFGISCLHSTPSLRGLSKLLQRVL